MTDDEDLLKLHMSIGESAQQSMEIIDQEVADALAEIFGPLRKLLLLLRDRDVSATYRVQLLSSVAIAAALDEEIFGKEEHG